MSIDQPRVVDFIGIEPGVGAVVLTLADHLEWGEPGHLRALQEKLNTYLAFIESGELLTAYPQAQGKAATIEVVCKHPPDADGVTFLSRAAREIAQAGFGFAWKVLSTNPDQEDARGTED